MTLSESSLGRILRHDSLGTPQESDSETSLEEFPELHPGGKGFKIITRARTLQEPNDGFIGEVPPGLKVACLGRGFNDGHPYGDFIAWRTGDLNITVERFSGTPDTQRRRGAKMDRETRVRMLKKFGHNIVAQRDYPGGVVLAVAKYPKPQLTLSPIGAPASNTER